MADVPEPASFSLDAILSEFNVGSHPALPQPADDAVARVRESFGLGRSIFRRKEPLNEEATDSRQSPDHAAGSHAIESKENNAPKASRPVRRIVETDDEDDLLPIGRPQSRSSSSYSCVSPEDPAEPAHNSDFDSDDDLSTEKFLEDYRLARAKALAELNAKAAAVNQEDQQEQEDEVSIVSERSPCSTPFASPSARKTKTRNASKKALEEMHKETQRMARNMGLRPEVNFTKKIDMSTIFAKFGFNPTNTSQENHPIPVNKSENSEPEDNQAMSTDIPYKSGNASVLTPVSHAPARFATPNLDDSDSDESLPTPSKLLSYLSQMPTKPQTHPVPTSKLSSPRRVHFTLPPSPSASDEDSDVEILPPPNLLTTHATTPDRKKIKRTAFIRSLAGVKSPGQLKKSPGRMTAKELDATLSREAAVQAKRKRDERRAELKSLGIDLEKIVEKRDLLEEAREEARRVRQEEGGDDESDDDEYLDEGAKNDGDDEESGGESGEESIDDVEERTDSDDEAENEGEDETRADLIQDVPRMRRGRKLRINSDDEDTYQSQDTVVPESTAGSHITSLPRERPVDDLSLTQFFQPTQLSGEQQTDSLRAPAIDNESTGLTQFFQSTAIEPEVMELNEGVAHGQMELLRQQAARTHMNIGDMPAAFAETLDEAQGFRSVSDTASLIVSPVQRRILKRRTRVSKRSTVDETSGEFLQSRKEFIEEQAEESEDDYKAWGSGDESDSENMDGVVEGLIDDETKVKRNAEEEVARLYMEAERERDEKFVQGLMHDLQNGGLRKRRGGNLDFGDWDSDDDDDEDAEERRRRWELRREEMKRRILEDENLGKLAANPKTQAFVNAISSSTLNLDDEPDFLGENDIIEDRKASLAARSLPHNVSQGDSQSQDQTLSPEVQVPATSSANVHSTGRDQRIIEELTQIEDSQPGYISLSEEDESQAEDSQLSFVSGKTYTGFIDRAAQKRASRTSSESINRLAFKAVASSSPARLKRTAVSLVERDDDSARKKVMKEIVGSKSIKRKAWGTARGQGAVTYRSGAGARRKENNVAEPGSKGRNPDSERRRKDILTLMDSQSSFC